MNRRITGLGTTTLPRAHVSANRRRGLGFPHIHSPHKAEAKPKLQALREQTAKLNKQLDEAKNATESTWNDVKAGVKKGWGELKDGFQQARQWVSEKIAP